MKGHRASLVAAVLLLSAGIAGADHEVVLVASSESAIDSLSILDVRKIYLGITVRHGPHIIRGLRNMSATKLDSIFLQSVVAMSEQAYERRLISGSLRFGRPRPVEYDTTDELIAQLSRSPDAISYMWREDAERLSSVKVLKILWHDY